MLNSQVSVTYKPNGTGSAKTAYIKNLGWHFARYNNIAYADDPLYCIEPYKNYAASTSGNSVDRDVTLTGSGSTAGATAWYSLPEARRKAIGLILLYSDEMWDHSISVTTTYKDDNPNVPLRIATQFLIYEIVCGLRDPETFVLNSANESGTAGNIFYNAGDSPYICVSENPQSVTVVQGRTAEVRFTNSLRSGKIAIRKVDTTGEPLAGAEFLLEWSVDGTSWLPVVYSNSGYAKEGTCSSEGLTDGRLISDKTGLVEFTGLHPERLYRLTETAAPDGFQLLADTAYEGGLPDDKEYTVDLTVVNVRTYELPETGSKSLVLMPIALILACSLCGAILFVTKRKKQ